jgi:ribosome-associated protein
MAEQAMRDADQSDLSSRSDARRARLGSEAALIDLGEKLIGLNQRQLAKLELPELLLQALGTAAAIDSPPARARAMKLVRRELRVGDEAAIRRRLQELDGPGRPPAPGPVEQWSDRLLAEGAPAIEAFLQQCPSAERQQLRALLRNVERATPASRTKALASLRRSLKALLSAAATEPSEASALESDEQQEAE